MAESYKRLGAIAPVDSGYKLLYTTPAATESLVSNITVTNRSEFTQICDIHVIKTGITQQVDLEPTLKEEFVGVSSWYANSFYSSDGITWILSPMPVVTGWGDVSYGNDTYVAVGYDTNAAISTDGGVSWTASTLPINAKWTSIEYGAGVFVAIPEYNSSWGAADIAATSTDGITWTQRTLPATKNWSSLIYSQNKFVSSAQNDTAISISTDGITWTLNTSTTPGGLIAYGNNLFIMIKREASVNLYATSTDAITWTQRTFPSTFNWAGLGYFKNKYFVMSMDDNNQKIIYSTDAITWQNGTMPASTPPGPYKIAQGNDVAVAGTQYRETLYRSTDAITWTSDTIDVSVGGITFNSYVENYSPENKTIIYKNLEINYNSTDILEPGISLESGASIIVKDNSGGNLTFSTYGVELS